MNLFIMDAETDGLYGKLLSIVAIVIDEKGNETDVFSGEVDISEQDISEEWVKENVFPHMGKYTKHKNESLLLADFWEFWLKHRKTCFCVADVPYPVETGIFKNCVDVDLKNRAFLAPFPLLDLSSMLFIKGIDPLKSRLELIENKSIVQHDPMNDVRIVAEIWRVIK